MLKLVNCFQGPFGNCSPEPARIRAKSNATLAGGAVGVIVGLLTAYTSDLSFFYFSVNRSGSYVHSWLFTQLIGIVQNPADLEGLVKDGEIGGHRGSAYRRVSKD